MAATLVVACVAVARAGELRIVAPSAPGSGWDQVAQALKTSIAAIAADLQVQVTNVPGAGGTVGLSQFLADGQDDALLVTGLTMLDATLVHRAPVGLDRMTPIARLSTEPFVVAVPASSAYRSLFELRAALQEDPGRVTWAGGPTAGIDHLAVILLARALGVDASRVNYAPFLTSGDAVAAVAESRVSVTVLSASEIATELKAARIRVLAVGAPSRVATIDAPTLHEQGTDLEISNWRGIVSRPGLPEPERERLIALASAVRASAGWQDFLARKGWRDAFLPGDAFSRFVAEEQARVKAALRAAGLLKPP